MAKGPNYKIADNEVQEVFAQLRETNPVLQAKLSDSVVVVLMKRTAREGYGLDTGKTTAVPGKLRLAVDHVRGQSSRQGPHCVAEIPAPTWRLLDKGDRWCLAYRRLVGCYIDNAGEPKVMAENTTGYYLSELEACGPWLARYEFTTGFLRLPLEDGAGGVDGAEAEGRRRGLESGLELATGPSDADRRQGTTS